MSFALPFETRQKIYELGCQTPRLGSRTIAKMLGIERTAVDKYRHHPPVQPLPRTEAEPDSYATVRKALRSDLSLTELADALDCSPSKARDLLEQMRSRGALINEQNGKYHLMDPVTIAPERSEIATPTSPDGEWTHKFGVTADNHLGNKHSRLDVLNAAYDEFARQGITRTFQLGNYIDGEAKFNKTELIIPPGMHRQLDYATEVWPQREGITTEFIDGDDHEGWYMQREGVLPGRLLQLTAEEKGRTDLKYLGYAEHDLALKCGQGEAVLRLQHPGGGSAYAHSYTSQKIVESLQGGEKPAILLLGHYHKWNVDYPREVHVVQCGCTCDQSLFMRKKKIQAHVGFAVIKVKQDPQTGVVTRFATEFFPFYNRGFYDNRRFQ